MALTLDARALLGADAAVANPGANWDGAGGSGAAIGAAKSSAKSAELAELRANLLERAAAAGLAPLLQRACAHLQAGRLLALPTETVYGLAADADAPEAVARVFAAKGRPEIGRASWRETV